MTSTSQHRAASAAAVTTNSQSGMDVDDTAGAALTGTPSVDKSPIDNLRRSPKPTLDGTPSPNPLGGPISSPAPARDDETTQMEVDSGGEVPLPLEPPSVPEANASPAVIESVAASSEEGDQGSLESLFVFLSLYLLQGQLRRKVLRVLLCLLTVNSLCAILFRTDTHSALPCRSSVCCADA